MSKPGIERRHRSKDEKLPASTATQSFLTLRKMYGQAFAADILKNEQCFSETNQLEHKITQASK